MVHCKNCNTENLPEAEFCENCGSKLESSPIKTLESENIQYCEECGSKVDENDAFCGNCGFASKHKCPKCNSENNPGSKFCSSCAHPLLAESKIDKNTNKELSLSGSKRIPERPVKKAKKKKFLLIPVFIIIIIGVLVFIFNVKVVDSFRYVTCSVCNGSTKIETTKTCDYCKGRGRAFCTETYTFNYTWFAGGGSETVTCKNGMHYNPRGDYGDRTCWACNGSTYHDCYECSGYGYIKTEVDCNNCDSDGEVREYMKITLAKEWGW